MSRMRECKLKDVATIIDCEHKTAPLVESSEYISVRTTDIANGRIYFDSANRVSYETYVQWSNRIKPAEGDLILAREAPVGEVGIIPKGRQVCLGQRTVLIRPNSVNAKYLLYYLVSSDVKNDLISRSTGSVVEHLNVHDIRNFDLRIPKSIDDQEFISEILSSLDDKIDLLHRQNKTLEALAETIFRQWFVEEADVSWEVGRLGDVLELVYGKALKEETRSGKGFPVVGSSGVVGYNSGFLVEGPGIVIGRKGTLGNVIYLFENFFPIDTTYFVKSKVNSVGLFYEYFLLKTMNFEDMNTDSAVPGLNKEIALSMEMKIAPFEKLQDFNDQCSTLFQKLKQNNNQILSLTQLRGSLLPKLMNGEVRVIK